MGEDQQDRQQQEDTSLAASIAGGTLVGIGGGLMILGLYTVVGFIVAALGGVGCP